MLVGYSTSTPPLAPRPVNSSSVRLQSSKLALFLSSKAPFSLIMSRLLSVIMIALIESLRSMALIVVSTTFQPAPPAPRTARNKFAITQPLDARINDIRKEILDIQTKSRKGNAVLEAYGHKISTAKKLIKKFQQQAMRSASRFK